MGTAFGTLTGHPAEWIAHGALLLLALASLRANDRSLRVALVLTLLVLLVYLFVRHSAANLFMLTLGAALLANIVQLSRNAVTEVERSLPPEAAELRDRHLSGLSLAQAEQLIRQGSWFDVPAGSLIGHSEDGARRLCYLARGAAELNCGETLIGHAVIGSVVGPHSFAEAHGAPAVARMVTPGRIWMIGDQRLRDYLEFRPELRGGLGAALTAAMAVAPAMPVAP